MSESACSSDLRSALSNVSVHAGAGHEHICANYVGVVEVCASGVVGAVHTLHQSRAEVFGEGWTDLPVTFPPYRAG